MKNRFNPYQKPTPQGKLIATADKFGNRGIKKMQGTTRHIWDYLPIGGLVPTGQEFRFFEGAQQRAFPFTNLSQGKLEVGEAMVLERMWFTIMLQTIDGGEIADVQSPQVFGSFGFYAGAFSFNNANNQVIKPTGVIKQAADFNQKSWHVDNEVIHLDTDITLQPLIEFLCIYRSPGFTVTVPAGSVAFLGCHIEGAGAILNPRANF